VVCSAGAAAAASIRNLMQWLLQFDTTAENCNATLPRIGVGRLATDLQSVMQLLSCGANGYRP